jgi:probable aminopeptidase NPEPL1
MVHICLSPSELGDQASQACDTFVMIGTAKGFAEHFEWACTDVMQVVMGDSRYSDADDAPKTKRAKTVSEDQELLQSILPGLQPSLDSGVSTECWFQRSSNSKPLRVVLGVLPASVSRHNAPGQPYAVSALLKKHVRPKETTAIVPLVESAEHISSTVNAIARIGGALMFSKKTGGDIDSAAGIDMKVVFPYPIGEKFREELVQVALGIQLTRRLVDAPCNELNTQTFTDQALEAIKGMEHVKSRVIKGKDLEEKGFGGLYSVGKAAEHPPAMVILMYEPPSVKDEKSIVLVGKGIVFDTGGMQIKTKAGMPGMKRDMGGAASILAAFLAAVRSDVVLKRPLHAILCLAENSVSQIATRPDDIITMYSGKTVEINNTDAEGRLVLGDGVASASQHLNPHVIIDMATLTGAQGVATGKYFGALYCNDEGLEEIALKEGRKSGDICHAMPYCPELFRPEFQSAVADMKNSVADRANAQVSCAGQFIGNHISDYLEKGGLWMHIDMAYPSFDKKDERATGYGVALLFSIVKALNSAS